MGVRTIRKELFELRLPGVNAFLLDSGPQGLVLVDTGPPGAVGLILEALHQLGREPAEIRHILVTHCHPDHAGGLADLKGMTGARIYMHAKDARLVAQGKAMRPMNPTPGILNRFLYRRIVGPGPHTVKAVTTDVELAHRADLPLFGGITALHTPGHTEGHLAFLVQKAGVLFLGDAAANYLGPRLMFAYEHVQQGIMSLRQLCRYDFELACFGHGPTILAGAAGLFRKRFGSRRPPPRIPPARRSL